MIIRGAPVQWIIFATRYLLSEPPLHNGPPPRPTFKISLRRLVCAAYGERSARPHLAKPRLGVKRSLQELLDLCSFAERRPLAENSRSRREIQRDAVDAIPQVGRRRAVIENMAEMAAAIGAMNFRAHHAIAPVRGYEHGPYGTISAQHMEGAVAIVRWHLNEAKRFLSDVVLPRNRSNARTLDEWLISECRKTGEHRVSGQHILQRGPSCTRNKKARDAALEELQSANRARVVKEAGKSFVELNPRLLEIDITS